MLHEEKRRAAFLSESAVGEANPIRFNELRGGRHVSVCHASFVRFCARKRPLVFRREWYSEKRCALLRSGRFSGSCLVL
jgi:hypothetical protein